jgi:tetratricopeptide (TPR) repeat protein
MLYEMVSGRPPFVGDESVAIIGQHLNTPPVAPTWHRPDCPPALESLILRLLEKDPNKRPESAAEVRQALQSISQPRGRTVAQTEPVATITNLDPLYRRTFVGRENEVRQLQQAFDGAMSGNGALVMVVGEPGIGKTALCGQLATYVALRGGKALVGHCYEEGSLSLPYLAFVEAMRSYVLARDPDGLRSDLGTGAADVARIVSEVRDRVQGVELRPAGDAEDDRWRLLQSVTSFLRNASAVQPLCIVLEDLHWADRGTLDLLLHVARNLQGARLLVVGTYRDVEVDRAHPLSGTLAELRRQERFLRVPLRGLTVDEVHRMYEALRGNEVPWAQAEAVHRQTEGNPLFVQEVLRFLVEEGYVVREGARYVGQGLGVGIPEGLRDVVGRRLNRLGERANQALSIASVIGRDFRLDVLQRVSALAANFTEEDVVAALEEAQERAIIEQREVLGTVGFRFTHAFFRQTLYEEIFAPRRIRVHQQVGRVLEIMHARRLDEHAAELAEHFTQSTESADLEKAVHYGEVAARRALSVFAYSEAVRHLEQALRAQEVLDAEDKASRCDLLIAMVEALNNGGDPRRALRGVAPEALAMAQDIGDSSRVARICRLAFDSFHAAMANQGWDTEEAKMWAKAAAGAAQPGTASQVWADSALGRVEAQSGDREVGLSLLMSAVDLARSLDDNALFWFATMMALETGGNPGLIRRESRAKYLSLADELHQRSRTNVSALVQRTALSFLGFIFLGVGLREKFDSVVEETRHLAERTKQPNLELLSATQEAKQHFLNGQLEAALELHHKTFERAQDFGLFDYISGGGFRPPYMRVLGSMGRADEGVNLWPRDAVFLRPWELALAGHHDQAHSALTVAREQLRLQAQGWPELAGFFGGQLLEAAVILKDIDSAKELLDCIELDELPAMNPVSMCPFPRVVGEAHTLLANPVDARASFEAAVQTTELLRHRPEIALSRLDLAELLLEHYPDERDAAIEHLDFAIAELRDMKMQPALERALRHRGLLKA